MSMAGHASRSGYTQITRGANQAANRITTDQPIGRLSKAMLSLTARWARQSGNQWYNRRTMRAEWAAARAMLAQTPSVVHFLYGENCYRYSGVVRHSWLGTNSRLVATYHTPERRFRELISDGAHISSLDAVVIMSEVQRPIFAELLDNDRVHFIPHGVDTDYFQPAHSRPPGRENESIRCITVGNHLRDYNSLAQIAERSAQRQLKVEFVVVANPRLVSALQGLSNVECLHGVDDNELLRLYQGADLLLLPLIDATANNTLLEGLACGLPVVASDLTGVRDYAPDSHTLYASSADEMVEHLAAVCAGKHELTAMGLASRARAEELSWDNIRIQLANLYEQL